MMDTWVFLPTSGDYSCKCKHCGERFRTPFTQEYIPVDFSKPEGFFWLWERAQEKEWWVDFLVKTYGPEYWHSVLNLGYLVHPTRFFDALYDFLKGGRT
jgi:hypothetical protein